MGVNCLNLLDTILFFWKQCIGQQLFRGLKIFLEVLQAYNYLISNKKIYCFYNTYSLSACFYLFSTQSSCLAVPLYVTVNESNVEANITTQLSFIKTHPLEIYQKKCKKKGTLLTNFLSWKTYFKKKKKMLSLLFLAHKLFLMIPMQKTQLQSPNCCTGNFFSCHEYLQHQEEFMNKQKCHFKM